MTSAVTSLAGKKVLVTGASSGIGAACTELFAREGSELWICARRLEPLKQLAASLEEQYGASVHPFVLDVSQETDVVESLSALPAMDVLINNAGLSRGLGPIDQGLLSDWNEMIDTNIKGLLYVSKTVLQKMVDQGQGHVIHIGSIAGREVYPGGAVYCGTKFAVRALAEGMRVDLCGSGVKVSSVDPGMVNTEFATVRFHGDREKADSFYRGMTPLVAMDVAETVVWVASRPAHVNVGEILILPTHQASAQTVHHDPS
jgi:3-hydroxy acid dehydrogenase/malonic semialdehyde reductase